MKQNIYKKTANLLTVVAILVAGLLFLFMEDSQIKRSWPILVASIFILPVINNKNVFTIQKLVFLYLFMTLVNQLSLKYIQLNFNSMAISLPLSFLVISILAVSFLLSIPKPSCSSKQLSANPLKIWAILITILITHISFLFVLLKKYYGYGYEYNMEIAGSVCLVFMGYLFMWGRLDNKKLMRICSTILFVVYLIFAFKSF